MAAHSWVRSFQTCLMQDAQVCQRTSFHSPVRTTSVKVSAMSMSVVDVASTHSGFSRSVTLPAYTLVNAGLVIERESWVLSASAKNLTDERYFRANFPNIFGGVIVLPELPRNIAVRVQYKW